MSKLDGQIKAGLFMMYGVISQMNKADQDAIRATADEIKAIVKKSGKLGEIAISVANSEVALDA